ncbi:unnamed protein product [Paramecium sonneborni]|uniref:Transmembrane protein n=1 Tax=Paramecium sonneborni TaxID=65129 RepID=A0A8S1RBJ5_9CILI|nr:unnamed protein product [Paramecium sonneborni]
MLIKMISSFISNLDDQEQLEIRTVNIEGSTYDGKDCFQIGVFSKYNPLGNVRQVGKVGIFDSNCFHLLSIADQSTQSLNFIYYQCINYESKEINVNIDFINPDSEQINKQANIDIFKYENRWHFFSIYYCPDIVNIHILNNEQSTLIHLILNKFPAKESAIIITYGGGLIVQKSLVDSIQNGRKFSFFPGKIYLIDYEFFIRLSVDEFINQTLQKFLKNIKCECIQNNPKSIDDIDIKWLKQEIYTISNQNCESFIFNGWFRIQEIIQQDEEFVYHFFQIKANFENPQLSNQNLAPLQIFYKLSPIRNQIIITTYSYTFPSVNIDFTNNPFLILKEIDIQNDIKLWHNIYVNLQDQQLTIKLNFYEHNNIYSQKIEINAHQFSYVQFKLYYGNLQQLTKNYLNIQVRNLIFQNCDDSLNENNCHYSCETCEGPTSTDCITCSEQSQRLYLKSFKSCICPYGMIEQNQQCISSQDFNFQIKQDQNQYQHCQYGYFEFEDSCIRCPSIINKNSQMCIECLNNPISWWKNPYCETNLVLNTDGDVAQKLYQKKIYYNFDGDTLQACLNCDQQDLTFQDTQYQDLILLNHQFIPFCLKTFNNAKQEFNCYECPEGCEICFTSSTTIKCLKCYFPFYLDNGICTQQPDYIQVNKCLSPYYFTSNKECKLCPIKKCLYCFEYYSNDLSKCTLYKNFEPFPLNEYLKVGCALCEDSYIFNFNINLCEYQNPKIVNCLRSYINENGDEICTLSSSEDFDVAPEIINCEKYISNCLQCIMTKFFVIKCTICKSDYTATIQGGFCRKSLFQNSKISVEANAILQDGWVQLILSFIMQFLPNQYFYTSGTGWVIQEISIQCQNGYERNQFGICVKYCDSNCQQCQPKYLDMKGDRYECKSCSLNYFKQPIRVQNSGKCIQCSSLCEVCSIRSKEEIQKINPNFVINNLNEIYTMKCIKQVSDPKVQLNHYLGVAKYCFEDETCNSHIFKEINQLCIGCTWYYFEPQYINFQLCNELGVKKITISRQYQKFDQEGYLAANQFFEIKSGLKENIFSLQAIIIKIIGFDNQIMIIKNDTFPSIINFDYIEFHNLIFIIKDSDYFTFENNNSKIDLLFKDCVINSSELVNTDSIFQTIKYGELIILNLTLSNLNFINSSFFTISQQNEIQIIKINTLYLMNCSFTNSQLFSFKLNKMKIQIENIKIDQCYFQNSSIFQFSSNDILNNNILFSQINLQRSDFYQSQIINSIDKCFLIIQHLLLQQNYFYESQAITHLNNFSIFYVEVGENSFIKSSLIVIDAIQSSLTKCQIYFVLLQSNFIQQSILLKFSTTQEIDGLIVDLNNLNFQKNDNLNNFNDQSSIIKASCFKLNISNIKIINSHQLQTFSLINIQEILIQNLFYENDEIFRRIPISLDCVSSLNFQHKLLETKDCRIIRIMNARIINQFNSDQALLSFISYKQDLKNEQEKIYLQNIDIFGNLLSKQSLTSFQSIISIYSENQQYMKLENLSFQQNFFHQHIDDPSEAFASLIYISSSKSEVEIINLNSQNNALTNSSTSYIFINSKIVKFINYTVFNHNILDQSLWSKYYEINFEQELEQNQINAIISQTFKFLNKGGASLITAASFFCLNSNFQNIISQRSSLFEIKTQGQGKIVIQNVSIKSLNNDLISEFEYSGCISIQSENSLLDLRLKNVNFENVFNKRSSSIFTIFPSLKQNYLYISNIQIINCISLKNPFLKIQFTLHNSYSNKMIIENVIILQNEDMWIDFIEKIGLLSLSEISDIISENSLIYIKGGDLRILNFQVIGIFITQIINLQSPSKAILKNIQISQIKTFYSLNLISITVSQDITSQLYINSIMIDKLQIYQISNSNTYKIQNKVIYQIVGCLIVQNSQFIDQDNLEDLSFGSLISRIQFNTQQLGSIINFESFSDNVQIHFTCISLFNNICTNCFQGLINLQLQNKNQVIIKELTCIDNYIAQTGCINLQSKVNLIQSVKISQSTFLNNNGTQGVAINSINVKLSLFKCLIMYNNAKINGGGLHLELNNNELQLKQVSIMHNIANEGGGIYLVGNSNLNSQNFEKSIINFNEARKLANNIVEQPSHLALYINQKELNSISISVNDTQNNILQLQPYKILQQGKIITANYLFVPSNQQISKFYIFNPKKQTYQSYIDSIQILFKNSQNEILPYVENCNCQIEEIFYFHNHSFIQGPILSQNQKFDTETNSIELDSIKFEFDPYQVEYSYFQVKISCQIEEYQKKLQYFFNAKTLQCQLGEFKVDNGCQKCQSNQGYYSVTYNTSKCSIFDQTKFQNITSNSIQLLDGYWRPNYQSDYTEYCFKNPEYCQGGWGVGNQLCKMGNLGGLCEECDKYNIEGLGHFFKDQQNLNCLECFQFEDSILPFILTSFWAFFSIFMTLRSIDKSNTLFTQLKIRQKFTKIIFKLNQDHESILLKMLLNYFWIFSVIFSFNIKFTFSINFMDQASNTSFFLANNLDCYLSQIQDIELIYSRIIATIILTLLQLIIVFLGFLSYSITYRRSFNRSMISGTALYLYVSNYAAIIKQFCSIISTRQISKINYIQGDVSLLFGFSNHNTWIFTFVIPGLGFFGCFIPFSLFFLMYIKQDQLDNIKLRRHICYLFNEYNSDKYYWEQIKLTKKTVIIIIMTYFEINIFLKASLLGLCLLCYQLLAVKNKPYIINSLNNLDLWTGQICSIAMFLAVAKYVSEQQAEVNISIILQILIMLLFIRLCFPFIFAIIRVYIRKHKVQWVSILLKLFLYMKADFCLTLYLNRKKQQLIQKEQKLKRNFIKLKQYLFSISKAQIRQHKLITTLMNSQSTLRFKLNTSELDTRKNFKHEIEHLFETNH